MNGRSGIFTIFLFIFLSVIVLFQVLMMLQSDHFFQRINQIDKTIQENQAQSNRQAERIYAVLNRLQRSISQGATVSATSTIDPIDPCDPCAITNPDAVDGDWLVWRLGTDATTLNPILSNDYAASYVLGGIIETLLERDLDTLEWRPLLAESWEVSEDGLEIWFRLRDDIHFSDGHTITADDIVFSLETIKDPCVDAAHLANYYQDIEYVEKINDREVRFHLSQCYFKSLSVCAGLPIIPQHIYQYNNAAEFNNNQSDPIGSGPYIFDHWNRASEIVLRRNENYWGQMPHLDRHVFRVIINDTAAIQALRSGDVDFVDPTPEQFVELSQDEEFSQQFQCLSYWSPGSVIFYTGWNQDTPFFADQRVRLAMTLMIDREAIVQHLLNGLGQVPTGPFSILSPQCDSTIQPWPYDPVRAAQLLDEAGWIDTDGDGIRDKLIDTNGDGTLERVPFSFKYMIVSGVSLHERIVRLVADSAAELGIEVIPDPYEWSVFIGRLNSRDFQAVNLAWGGAVESDPYQVWHSSQIQGGSNYIGFNNPQADQIIEQARRTLDEDARNQLYHQLHRLLHEEQPYTFIYTRPSPRFIDPRFQNVIIHTLGLDPDEWFVPFSLQRY
ncbi:MAG: peptide-binding protein [Sedimentisphaerales bacterium]|nr:peptide-binding protein [Sedimentisphaerales bacterium]